MKKNDTLIGITMEHLAFLKMLHEVDFDENLPEVIQALAEQAQSFKDDTARKLESYRKMILKLQLELAFFKAETASYQSMGAKRERLIERLKENVKQHLLMTGEKRAYCESMHYFLLATNGGQQAVDVASWVKPEELPEKFRKVTVEANTDALRKALTSEDDEVRAEAEIYASLRERGSHIQIK